MMAMLRRTLDILNVPKPGLSLGQPWEGPFYGRTWLLVKLVCSFTHSMKFW